MVKYLEESDVRAALRWDELIAAMESAHAASHQAKCCSPSAT
jgi:hypothetical protein